MNKLAIILIVVILILIILILVFNNYDAAPQVSDYSYMEVQMRKLWY